MLPKSMARWGSGRWPLYHRDIPRFHGVATGRTVIPGRPVGRLIALPKGEMA